MYRLFKPLIRPQLKFGQVSIATNTSFHTDRELRALNKNREYKVEVDRWQKKYEETGSLHDKLALENARQKYQDSFNTVKAIWKLEEKTLRPR